MVIGVEGRSGAAEREGGPLQYELIQAEKRGSVAWLTFDRPAQRDAFNRQMMASELGDHGLPAEGEIAIGAFAREG